MFTLEQHLEFLQDPEGYYERNPNITQFTSIQPTVQSPFVIVDRETVLKDLCDFLEREVPSYLGGNDKAKQDFTTELAAQLTNVKGKIDEVFERTSNGALKDTPHENGNNGWFWNKHYEGVNTLQGVFINTAATISQVLTSKHCKDIGGGEPDLPSRP